MEFVRETRFDYIRKLYRWGHARSSLKGVEEKVTRLFLRVLPSDAATRSVPRTKIIIAMSKRAGRILRGWGEGRNVTHVAIIPGLPPLKRGAILSRVGPAFYISGSKNLPWQSNPFHTPSTGCIPYAYPVQLQQLVTEPRQGSLPCILHASLHVLVVHIT